jgi:hypothetical protein
MANILKPGAPVTARESEWAEILAEVSLAHERVGQAIGAATKIDIKAFMEQGYGADQEEVFDDLKALAELYIDIETAAFVFEWSVHDLAEHDDDQA